MFADRTNKVALPRDVQLMLGAELRWTFSSWAMRIPMPLLRLASKTVDSPKARPESLPSDEPISWCERGVIDEAGARIFDQAFKEAWSELQDLDFSVHPETLARCISTLIVRECDPARLKTKAIILLSRNS